jgi:N-formylglutamate amidohydrolase
VLWVAIAILPFLFASNICAEDVAPGQSRLAEKGRVEYIVGNAPIIVSAPHGGRLKPSEIADRKSGVLLTDTNTDLLAMEIAKAFHERTGGHVHVVICHLKRTKVDCNRPLDDATEGDPEAIATWRAFHGFIENACKTVTEQHGRGLLLDMHAHGHPIPRIELGYALRNSELKLPSEKLEKLAGKSSVRDLTAHSPKSFVELMSGPTGMGGLLQARGFDCVPSTKNPHAGNAKYFSGGYITRRYSLAKGSTISAIQFECPLPGVRRTKEDRNRFAKALVDASIMYMKTHAGIDLSKSHMTGVTR